MPDPAGPDALNGLLARVALGDRQAFSSLYQASSAKLFGFALRILGQQDLAEEAVQDAFIKIWQNAGTFRPELASARTWMAAIVRNRALDLLRAAAPEQRLGEDQSFDEWAAPDLGPLEQAAASSESRALMRCLGHLQPLQRQAIALSYFHGLAHEELAKRLTQPLGTIKTWIRRGLMQLKSCLGGA